MIGCQIATREALAFHVGVSWVGEARGWDVGIESNSALFLCVRFHWESQRLSPGSLCVLRPNTRTGIRRAVCQAWPGG